MDQSDERGYLFGIHFEMGPRNLITRQINIMVEAQSANMSDFRICGPRRFPMMASNLAAFGRHIVQICPQQKTRPMDHVQMRYIAAIFWNFLKKIKYWRSSANICLENRLLNSLWGLFDRLLQCEH